ncbi:hypothetical protein [Stenotrophomonas sp.]|uniref:hypothetical protein n=1 Tax=Stenotrophomonas sp. TaxID=69392 RepID=UPI002897E91F|nr:hypothetical protein [Stenotrophomonas sp.]
MPLDSPTASTLRPWVAVYTARSTATRLREEPPPTYDEAVRIPPIQHAPHLLPPSRAVPLQVENRARSWRPFSVPPHPLKQERKLQKQLERRERTQRKLDAAQEHLHRILQRHADFSASGRVYCGGGLFDDEECTAITLARHAVEHYAEKKIELQDAHAAQLRRRNQTQSG